MRSIAEKIKTIIWQHVCSLDRNLELVSGGHADTVEIQRQDNIACIASIQIHTDKCAISVLCGKTNETLTLERNAGMMQMLLEHLTGIIRNASSSPSPPVKSGFVEQRRSKRLRYDDEEVNAIKTSERIADYEYEDELLSNTDEEDNEYKEEEFFRREQEEEEEE